MIADARQVVGDDRETTRAPVTAMMRGNLPTHRKRYTVCYKWRTIRQAEAQQRLMRLPVVAARPFHSKSAN